MEVAGFGIDVMLVAPGAITSQFGKKQSISIKTPAGTSFPPLTSCEKRLLTAVLLQTLFTRMSLIGSPNVPTSRSAKTTQCPRPHSLEGSSPARCGQSLRGTTPPAARPSSSGCSSGSRARSCGSCCRGRSERTRSARSSRPSDCSSTTCRIQCEVRCVVDMDSVMRISG